MVGSGSQFHSNASTAPTPLQDLVHLVMRMFYEPRHIILMDLLTQAPMYDIFFFHSGV